jgi:hypothetical protein
MSVNQQDLIVQYEGRGLTRKESETLADWIEAGKPGLSKYRAENMGNIYALGYSCEDIHRWYPTFPLSILLWARVQYGWDDVRDRYQRVTQGKALEAAIGVKTESVRLLADTIAAVNLKWRRELMDYLSDPEHNKAPDFLPKSLSGYQSLQAMMKELTDPIPSAGAGGTAGPLVSVSVGQGGTVKLVDPKAVADSLIAEMKNGG